MDWLKKLLFIFLLVFLFFSFTKNIFDYQKNLSFYQEYKSDYTKEQKRNLELKTEILKKNSYFEIEKTIRNKLNLTKPDEIAIMLPIQTPSPSPPTPTPLPNYLQWWNVFVRN